MTLPIARRRFVVWLATLLGSAVMLGAQVVGPTPFLGGAWSGNVTTTSATVSIRLGVAGQRVRLAVSANEQLTAAVFSAPQTTESISGNAVSLDVAGLQPNTAYFYGIEVNGTIRTEATSRGRFRTFPQGAASFKIALVGDGDYRDADQRAYAAVQAEDPLLILFIGDLHYSDLNTTNPEDYRIPYDNTLKHPVQGPLFRSAPVAFVWDDHDFAGGDNSNGTATGGAAARIAYDDCVPHYPLLVGDNTIGQAFTVGRVRIIMTDLRSAAHPQGTPDSASKSRMGPTQKAWFKQQLLSARDANFPLILWVSTDPWVAATAAGEDTWGGYATERTELADFFKENRIRNLVVLCGDMHALAYDDGTHSDYATGGGAPVVVIHSAPLSREPNVKGGPYTAGPFLASRQYGVLEVLDNGGSSVQCRYTGKRLGEGAKMVFQFASSASAIDSRTFSAAETVADRALVNISARGRISSPTDTLTAGFVVAGRTPRNLLLRAVGPSLAAFGVADALARPAIRLFRGSTVVASNDDWALVGVARLVEVFDRSGAFRYAGIASRDAALYLTLDPGAYTLETSSLNGATGSVLVEVYEVP